MKEDIVKEDEIVDPCIEITLESTAADLIAGILVGPVTGALKGIVGALGDPLFFGKLVKKVRSDTGQNYFYDFVVNSSSLATYGAILYEVGKRITDEPTNLYNYIPIAANLLSGVVQIAYKIGKKNKKKSLDELV